METIEALLTRRSVRNFVSDKMPEQALIDKVVKAGTYAPSGKGKQPAVIVERTDKVVRDRLSELNAQVMGSKGDPFYGAPVVLAVLADRERPTYIYDGSLVMGNLLIAAHSLGLGCCWIHRAKEIFASEEGLQMLYNWGITGDYEGIGFCVLGYASSPSGKAAQRKSDYVYHV